jgi:lipopolysaccharide exporter
LIGTPIALALALAAPLVTPIVFGQRWQQAGVYVAILAPFFLFQLATSPLGGTLDVLERQDLHLIRELVRVSITSGAIVLADLAHFTATQAIALFSFCGCIGYVLHGLISWIAIAHAGTSGRRPRSELHAEE